MGFEPTTTGITILDSTIELQLPLIGAGYRNRTDDERLEIFSFAPKLIPL